jgi:superfamily II DNA/RNA helicase
MLFLGSGKTAAFLVPVLSRVYHQGPPKIDPSKLNTAVSINQFQLICRGESSMVIDP